MAGKPEAGTLDLMSDRMFLALELGDEARHAVAAHLQSSLGGKKLPGKPVPPENWHITMRFLGPTKAVERDAILAHLDQHVMVEPFRIRFTEFGGFPREEKASVLWLGIDGDLDSLSALAMECETAAQSAGMEPEGRPFHPHLTLSRIRPPFDIRTLAEQFPPARIVQDVSEVTLYRSVFGSGPVRYEAVERVSL